jgi:hypothetical protein
MGTDFAPVGGLLSSPARAAMLEALLDGPLGVDQLEEAFGISTAAPS